MLKSVAAKQRSGEARVSFVLGAVVVLGLSACADSTALPSEANPPTRQSNLQSPPGLADRYIVELAPGVIDPPGMAVRLTQAHGGTVHFVYTRALQGFAATLPAAALEALQRNPGVRRIERDQVVSGDNVQTAATWGLDRVDQRALPLSTTYSYAYTGAGVSVYVFDTGIRLDHTEFEGRARRGYDAINDGRNGADCNGHGTHVAGTIGGRTYGVAKGVQLVSVRVLGCDGYGLYSGMIAGMDWVLRNRTGPAVANFSLGGSISSTLNSALASMISAGVQTSVSAGNNSADACTRSPASTASAVTVAASTSADSRASYSNYGSCVDIFAPGSNIRSASYASTTGATTMSGTSMAAPHAAGVLALLLQQQPGLSAQQLRDWLVNISTRSIVTNALSANAHLVYSVATGTSVPVPTTATLPASPTNLRATQGRRTKVSLSWQDGSANESGFRIGRKQGTGTWATLATVGANTTSFTDGGVKRGVTYTYRVWAYNSAGSSGFSNEAAVTVK